MPKVKGYDELNDYLRQCYLNKLGHHVADKQRLWRSVLGKIFKMGGLVFIHLDFDRYDM